MPQPGPTVTATLGFLRRNGVWLVTFAFLGLALARRSGYLLPAPSVPAATEAAERPEAPSIAGEPLEPGPSRLADYGGKVVLLNFWATWCPPCRAEMPSMQALYEAYRERGLVVLAVSVDVQGRSAVAPFIEARKLTFPVLLDPRSVAQSIYGVGAIPTSFLLDRRGRIVSREVGAMDWNSAAARSIVERLLGEPDVGGGT